MLIAALIATLSLIFWPRSNALSMQFDQTKNLIKKDVHDEARRKQALKIVEQAEETQKSYESEQGKMIESLAKLLDKRETTASEIEAALHPLYIADHTATQKQLDWRFELKTVLNEGEWAEVFPPPGGGG
jgi:hydrogenase maturation factor HypF (carbamoyltransferase family)